MRYCILKGVSGDRHHFIQASLLGGFGQTSIGKKQRDADIELRRRGSATTESTTPDQVGWEDKLYRLLNAGPGADPDAVDKAWTPLENGYRDAVANLEKYSTNSADIAWLISYVCAAGVRHPGFGDAVNRWRAAAQCHGLSGFGPWWVVLFSVTFCSSGFEGMAVAGVPRRWRAGSTGRPGFPVAAWRVSAGRASDVPAVQAGLLAMVMTAGAMRVTVSFGLAWPNVLGDLDLRARCRFRSVTVRYPAMRLVSAW